MGSLVGSSSLVPGTCLGPGNHSFAFGAPSPAGKELVIYSVSLVAPKAQFQLVAVCDVVDFGCPPGMYVPGYLE